MNELAEGQEFLSVGARSVSDDGNLLAFTTDMTGFREYELSVKDLRTGKLVESKFVKATQIEWAADNQTLFYVTEDDAKRDHKLWRHTLGQPQEKDTLVLEEKDELFTVGCVALGRREVPVPLDRQLHQLRAAVPAGGPAGRPVERDPAARARSRVLRRPPGRPVLHPHEPARPATFAS